jgi:hypothetical protein
MVSYKRRLLEGQRIEAEHKNTIKKIMHGNISVSKAERLIAADHIREDKNYYLKLKRMERRR